VQGAEDIDGPHAQITALLRSMRGDIYVNLKLAA
jgi:hypothetical protein